MDSNHPRRLYESRVLPTELASPALNLAGQRGFDMDNRTLTVSQTAYRGQLRDFGKTRNALRTVHLPEGLANDLWLWKQECPAASPDAFIFPNARKRNGETRNGFIRTDNYRSRVLKKLQIELGLPKLNFQVLRRTIATLAQSKGSVKDVQGILGHSKADTTVNVYMQLSTRVSKRRSMRFTPSRRPGPNWFGYRERKKFGTLWYGGYFWTVRK